MYKLMGDQKPLDCIGINPANQAVGKHDFRSHADQVTTLPAGEILVNPTDQIKMLREALEMMLLGTDSWKADDLFHDARINARKALAATSQHCSKPSAPAESHEP